MEDLMNAPVTPVAESSVDVRLGFLKRVYAWMTAGLLMTAIGAAISVNGADEGQGLTWSLIIEPMLSGNGMARFLNGIIMFAVLIGLGGLVNKVRHTPTVNVLAFGAYAMYLGFFVSGTILVAMVQAEAQTGSAGTYIYQAFGATLVVFGALTATAFYSKRDFSFVRQFAQMGVMALIGIWLMSFIFDMGSTMSWVVTFIGIMTFSAYTLYDTQKVMKTYPANEHVAGAMALFTDFVFLFIYILRMVIALQSSD